MQPRGWRFHLVTGMWDLRLHGFMTEEELAAPRTSEPDALERVDDSGSRSEGACLGPEESWWEIFFNIS
ncbi:mCG145745 [Mus musculus]|nr:mCG145745 [Mus musculus]